MGEIPVWTIVLGIIGLLINIAIGLLIWTVSQKLADIKQVLTDLAAADRALSDKVSGLDRALAEHKLHVSEKYVRMELHSATTAAIFNSLRETKEEIIERVQELFSHLETRMNGAAGRQ